jgi:hypothetical protein
LVKTGIKSGMILYKNSQEMVSDTIDSVKEVVDEAKSEVGN